jgi:hypothetical protein
MFLLLLVSVLVSCCSISFIQIMYDCSTFLPYKLAHVVPLGTELLASRGTDDSLSYIVSTGTAIICIQRDRRLIDYYLLVGPKESLHYFLFDAGYPSLSNQRPTWLYRKTSSYW